MQPCRLASGRGDNGDDRMVRMTEITDLAIPGAWVATPKIFPDDRGTFHEWFKADVVADKLGYPLDIPQANLSTSKEGVIRGVHFADVPPGQAKYVTCVAGRIVDVLVDLRRGSPTFMKHIVVELSAENRRGLYVPVGVGHAPGIPVGGGPASLNYLMSEGYNPSVEHGINPLDPALGIDWGAHGLPMDDLVLSDKDRDAPTVAEFEASGRALPSYDECLGWEKELRLTWEAVQQEVDD